MQRSRKAPTRIPSASREPRRNGQALVEFALILPVFMLIFMGILQFGFLLSGQIGLINSVREASRYGSTSPVSDSGVATGASGNICTYLTGTVLKNNMAGFRAASVVKSGATKVQYQSYQNPDPSVTTYSVRLTVTVSYRHPLFVPLVGQIVDGLDGTVDGFFTLGASEAMRVENPTLTTNPTLNTTFNCP